MDITVASRRFHCKSGRRNKKASLLYITPNYVVASRRSWFSAAKQSHFQLKYLSKQKIAYHFVAHVVGKSADPPRNDICTVEKKTQLLTTLGIYLGNPF
jgi:hypothetical protein